MSRLPRAVWVPAVVVGWIAVVLVLDSGAGLGVQRLLGAATWLLLVGLLAGECRSVRLQVAAVVVAATALEYTASVLMGLYTYRLENVPAFVPPGHGLVYLAALTIGGAVARTHGYRPFVLAALVLGAGWAAYGLLLSARPDTGGAVLFVFLAGFLLRGRQPAVYAAAFFVTGYLELLGTGIGTWAWARQDFLGVTTLGNPPSGIAGGYGWLDMVGILVAARFAATAAPVPAPAPPLVPAHGGGGAVAVEQRTASAAGDAVDLDRYPIADLGAPRARELIERCRGQLQSEGLCVLHGFLRPEAVERAVEQARSGLAGAHAKERAICAYDDEDIDPGLPAGDPVRKLHRHSMRVIAYDRLGADSPVRRLYEWDGLTAFLSEVLEEPVHTCADLLLSVVVTAMGDGQEQGWHFDDNDYVVSLLLQRAERGGEFEYAPMIRDGADQAYDRVRAVFAGAGDEVRVAPADAGTLALFRGRRSVHRVSPVSGDRDRLIALLSFDSRPGMMFPAEVQRNNVGRTAG